MEQSFFATQKKQSEIKSTIVINYFIAWAKILINTMLWRRGQDDVRVCFIDLFAGRGRYEDGTPSTPLLLLKRVIKDNLIRNHLVSVFNDKNTEFTKALEEEILSLDQIDCLKYQPRILNDEIGEELPFIIKETGGTPSLCFIDPIGYKGLTLKLVKSVIKGWGSEVIFFFNYNRINHIGIPNPNPKIVHDMNNIFGESNVRKLKTEIKNLDSQGREEEIIASLKRALVDEGCSFVLPFFFKREGERRTSHYLIHATKHIKGLDVMKGTMEKLGSGKSALAPSFGFDDATEEQRTLFHSIPPFDFPDQLCKAFYKREMKFEEIYSTFELSNNGTCCTRNDYRSVLKMLEKSGRLDVTGGKPGRGIGTYGKNDIIRFKR